MELKNRYFIMRHGESQANIQGIILSNPGDGIPEYGLTEKGRKEAESSIKNNKELDSETVIFSSDFKRARETAEIVKKYLNAEEIHLTPNLRERNFGQLDGTSNRNYDLVWIEDAKDASHKKFGVESVEEVLKRGIAVVEEAETIYSGKKILLVSHGDTLQILMTDFLKIPSSSHREVKHLETAEIREL